MNCPRCKSKIEKFSKPEVASDGSFVLLQGHCETCGYEETCYVEETKWDNEEVLVGLCSKCREWAEDIEDRSNCCDAPIARIYEQEEPC